MTELETRTPRLFTPEDRERFTALNLLALTSASFSGPTKTLGLVFGDDLLILYEPVFDFGEFDFLPDPHGEVVDLWPIVGGSRVVSSEGVEDGVEIRFSNNRTVSAPDWEFIYLGD